MKDEAGTLYLLILNIDNSHIIDGSLYSCYKQELIDYVNKINLSEGIDYTICRIYPIPKEGEND